MEQVAKFFGFDLIDPFEQAKALAAIRDREAAEDQALALQRGWRARMVADGLIREPGSRTRAGEAPLTEVEAAALTFAAAGAPDLAAELLGGAS